MKLVTKNMSYYNLKKLPELQLFLTVALNKSFKVITHKLDCRESFARQQQNEKTIRDIIDLSLGEHFSFATMIWRKKFFNEPADYWEVCATGTEDDVEYFVWMSLSEKEGGKLIEDYNLQDLN